MAHLSELSARAAASTTADVTGVAQSPPTGHRVKSKKTPMRGRKQKKKQSKKKTTEKKVEKKQEEQKEEEEEEEDYEVEKILSHKTDRKLRARVYLVKWKGYPSSENSWIPEDNFGTREILDEYIEKYVLDKDDAKKDSEDPEPTTSSSSATKRKQPDPSSASSKSFTAAASSSSKKAKLSLTKNRSSSSSTPTPISRNSSSAFTVPPLLPVSLRGEESWTLYIESLKSIKLIDDSEPASYTNLYITLVWSGAVDLEDDEARETVVTMEDCMEKCPDFVRQL
ncbi:hypothetical protein HDU79_010681 [Rhizoclosmatium sp. JEL0117]|nr:hypothetical protein HDU79_010681 [Rhizoclosmatium sp. JEL0117]